MTIILIIAIVILGWFVLSYNGFVRGKNQYTEAWADIEVQLKRRYDLIPNLVNTVKGYATHESSAFEKVTEARSRAMQASSLADHASAEVNLGKAVTGLFGIAEAYPDLKANTNFIELQRELSDTENKIQAARRFYNGTVKDFNTRVQSVPSNIVAKMFGFKNADFFDLPDNDVAQQPVEVKF
ncbi:MAG TPA: LemA family protein [Candidatus Paceibacterota bacterium]|jgi:LemA protein|nr:LemA family protein [Candidatus Paceibacterota bacterium]